MPNTGFKWRYKNQSGYCCANFIFHISLGDSTSQMQFCAYKYVTEIAHFFMRITVSGATPENMQGKENY